MPAPTFNPTLAGSAPNQLSSWEQYQAEIQRVLTETWDAKADVSAATPSYGSRAEAVAQASGLPAAISRIIVQEGTATVTRLRTATSDDPLYATGSRWGVVQRQDAGAVLVDVQARVASYETPGTKTPGIKVGGRVTSWDDGRGFYAVNSPDYIEQLREELEIAPPDPVAIQRPRVYKPERKFWVNTKLAAIKSSRTDALSIAVLSDSWLATSSYILQDMRLQFASAGYEHGPVGFIDIGQDNNGWAGVTNTRTGTWSYNTTTSSGVCLTEITATGTAAFALTASVAHSTFRILHAVTNGVLELSFDGGATYAPITLNAAAGYTDVTPATPALTIMGRWASGTTTIKGIDLRRAGKGITWHKLGRNGSDTTRWTAGTNRAEWVAGFAALRVDAVFILFGTNDATAGTSPAQFAANLLELISRIREAHPGVPGLPGPDIILCPSPDCYRVEPIDMTPYLDAGFEVADSVGATVFNLQGFVDPTVTGLWDTNASGTTNGYHIVRSLSGLPVAKAITEMLINSY